MESPAADVAMRSVITNSATTSLEKNLGDISGILIGILLCLCLGHSTRLYLSSDPFLWCLSSAVYTAFSVTTQTSLPTLPDGRMRLNYNSPPTPPLTKCFTLKLLDKFGMYAMKTSVNIAKTTMCDKFLRNDYRYICNHDVKAFQKNLKQQQG